MRQLSDLKKGDYILIDYGYKIEKVKVLSNDIKNDRLLIRLYFINAFLIKLKLFDCVLKYNDYNFENFDLLNN